MTGLLVAEKAKCDDCSVVEFLSFPVSRPDSHIAERLLTSSQEHETLERSVEPVGPLVHCSITIISIN